MPPRTRRNREIHHDNGALQTTFEANPRPANAKSNRGGKGRGKKAIPSDTDGANPPHADSNATSKRLRGQKAQQAGVVIAPNTAAATAVMASTAAAITPTAAAAIVPMSPTTAAAVIAPTAAAAVAPPTSAVTVAPATAAVAPTTTAIAVPITTIAPTTAIAVPTPAIAVPTPATVAFTITPIAATTVAPTTRAFAAVGTNFVDDDEGNPFFDPPTCNYAPRSLNDNEDDEWTSSESEPDASLQNRKEARDVKDFFSLEKGGWYCKYCVRNQVTTPHRNQVTTPHCNQATTPHRSQAITPHRNRNQAKTPWRHRQKKAGHYDISCSTTTLRRHLANIHWEVWIMSCKEAGIEITSTSKEVRRAFDKFEQKHGREDNAITAGPFPVSRKYTSKTFLDAIVKWIVADDQSINVIENVHLRSIFLMLNTELNDRDIPHRTKVRSQIMELWNLRVRDLGKEMREALGKISFTADCWSDPNLRPFMAITAHWMAHQVKSTSQGPHHTISLQSELIAFHWVPDRHTGEHLATVFQNILDRYQIQKIGWITLDNASNNDTLVSALELQLNAQGINFLSDERRIRCFPHVVNLAVQAVLSSITNIYEEDGNLGSSQWSTGCDVIAKLRTLINKIRSSSHRRQNFEDIQKQYNHNKEPLRLICDVPTRWSSTQLMIARALQLRQAIDIFMSRHPELANYRLNPENWIKIKAFAKILEVPHAFQQKLSNEKTPTLCEALPSFQRMIATWERYQEDMPEYSLFIEAGLSKLQTYFHHAIQVPAYQLAILLHPLKKLSWFTQHMPDKVQDVYQMFLKSLEQYQASDSSLSSQTPQSQHGIHHTTDSGANWADAVLGMDLYAHGGPNRSLQAEVDMYFNDISSVSYPNIMTFWQENQHRYPTIFRLAMDVLAIQGSAVPCERVFSSGKETMSARRSRIKYDLMEALQMLKFSFNHNCELNFTAGSGREAELKELEELDIVDSLVPEAFQHGFTLSVEDNGSSDSFFT